MQTILNQIAKSRTDFCAELNEKYADGPARHLSIGLLVTHEEKVPDCKLLITMIARGDVHAVGAQLRRVGQISYR